MASERFALMVPSDPRYLQGVRQFYTSVLEQRCDDKMAADLVLALDECCANVIRHRNATIGDGMVRIEAEFTPDDRLVFRIRAFCRPEEVACIKPRALDEIRPGGLGTHIVDKIMDRVAFEPDPERPECLALVLEKHSVAKSEADTEQT